MNFQGTQLSFALEDGILEVRLHREPCNEIGTAMLAELERVADAIRAPAVRALLVASTVRRGFCAGADLRELYRANAAMRAQGKSEAERIAELRRFLDRIGAVFQAIDNAPIPTVAAVHGVCFGGGFELALTCDLIIADRTARFCFPELRLGVVPGFGGIPRLRRDVGSAVIRDLLLTGRSVGASRAHELGWVSQVVAPGQHFAVARRAAAQACRFDRRAVAAAKAMVKPTPHEAFEREKDLFCALFANPVVEEALARFDADRSPFPYLPPSSP